MQIYKDMLPFPPPSVNPDSLTQKNILTFLSGTFNIHYLAPYDARNTGLQENSFHFISSNATFEHIPAPDILPVLNECFRLLKKGGICSLTIDYRDHWVYFDKSISYYNFLKYSDQQFRWLNPPLNYQNRLRHSDYLALIDQTLFETVEIKPVWPEPNQTEELKKIEFHPSFSNYDFNDLSILDAHIILRK